MSIASYLKKHSEALVKDVGVEAACQLTGKSKATLGRYYSDSDEHADRFMPIDVVAQLEAASRFPHVTSALADLKGITLSYDAEKRNATSKGVNQDVVALAQRFAMLMSEYNAAISDGKISVNEAKRMLHETLAIQHVLLEMKLNLEDEVSYAGWQACVGATGRRGGGPGLRVCLGPVCPAGARRICLADGLRAWRPPAGGPDRVSPHRPHCGHGLGRAWGWRPRYRRPKAHHPPREVVFSKPFQ